MTEKTPDPDQKAPPPKPSREDRLRAALRANLQRRKAQARARAAEDGTEDTKDE